MDGSELRSQLEKYHKASYGWALSCCHYDQNEAEEVLQTTYVKVLEGKACFQGKANFRTWLFKVIRNTALDIRRKNKLRRIGLSKFINFSEDQIKIIDPISETLQVQQNGFLKKNLSRLSRRQHQILHLVFYQGLTIQEAGEILKISTGSARKHFERGKKGLRKLIEKSEIDYDY